MLPSEILLVLVVVMGLVSATSLLFVLHYRRSNKDLMGCVDSLRDCETHKSGQDFLFELWAHRHAQLISEAESKEVQLLAAQKRLSAFENAYEREFLALVKEREAHESLKLSMEAKLKKKKATG